MFIDFLAGLSFYLIPFLTGRLFTKRIFFAYIYGVFFWFGFYFVLGFLSGHFDFINFSETIRLSAIIISGVSFLILMKDLFFKAKFIKNIKIVKTDNLVYSFLIIISVYLYFFIWKANTPYPLQLNWDVWEHITVANKILEGHLSFFPSKISDTFTFDAYSPMFAILLSIPKAVFNTSLLGVYWWLEYWHYLLTIIASFIFAKAVFRNSFTAFVSSLISVFVFESNVVYGSLFLIPQTLAALMAVFLIIEAIKEEKRKLFFILPLLAIILIHYIIGLSVLFVFLLFYFFLWKNISQKQFNLLILFSFLVFLAAVGLNHFLSFNLTDREEAAYYNFSLLKKLNYFADWYGIGLPIFFIIGLAKIIRGGQKLEKMVLICAFLILAVVFSPFSYAFKFYAPGRYFANLVVGLGLAVLLFYIPRKLRIFALFWVILLFLVVFYTDQTGYKEFLSFKGSESHVSKNEIEAGNWLSKNVPASSILVSDPSTQYVFEAISEVNSQGGVYMNRNTRQALTDINSLYDSEMVARRLLTIHDQLTYEKIKQKGVVFVASGRYFAWQKLTDKQKLSFFYNVWTPSKLEEGNRDYIDFLIQSGRFKKIYESDEMIILTL
ncbi:MAG: hypothetical protein Q8P80_02995 [Candidatus Levybacteria bacterium]|nr:hypothetical protein [Candidatus Levybacteria bacterium]